MVLLPINVVVASGNVIVLSAVGFVTVSVVSKAFAVAPSNTIDFKLVIAKSPSPSVELYVTSLKSVKASVSLPPKLTVFPESVIELFANLSFVMEPANWAFVMVPLKLLVG